MDGNGKIAWLELNTWDADTAKAFYGETFGWEFHEGPATPEGLPPYWIAQHNGDTVCGVFTLRSPEFDGVPSHWLTYIGVDDIAATIAAVRAADGVIHREPFEIPKVGTIAIVGDPTGAAFGVFQPVP